MDIPCASPHEARIRAATILLIEDDPLSLSLTVAALETHGFHNIIQTTDSASALAALRSSTPDLVILDLVMPDTDGFDICRALKSKSSLQDVPILAYTALDNEEKRLTILTMGASDLAIKPINPEELIARCRIHLEKRFILKDLQDYRSRMEEDLANARAMQNMLMPDIDTIKSVEAQHQLDISTLFMPSMAIGGDFWGIHRLPSPHKLALYIGDFTGHGVTAAINVFRLCALMGKLPDSVLAQPAECLAQINQQLHAILPVELYATMFYGVLDTHENTVEYCVAGSLPPLLLRQATRDFTLLEGSGLPLAATANASYRSHKQAFHVGDTLMLYSDALTETPNRKNEYLSIDAVGESLASQQGTGITARMMLKQVDELFNAFTDGVPPKDDFTLNFYRRLPD
ncbi:MAG: response regulator [Alphaproteobacteria bacterium]|nr:response regulator [Alphaproteobacteria bacterium]